jgi:hypothetical protein
MILFQFDPMNFTDYPPIVNTAVLVAMYLLMDRRLRRVETGLSRLEGMFGRKKGGE